MIVMNADDAVIHVDTFLHVMIAMVRLIKLSTLEIVQL